MRIHVNINVNVNAAGAIPATAATARQTVHIVKLMYRNQLLTQHVAFSRATTSDQAMQARLARAFGRLRLSYKARKNRHVFRHYLHIQDRIHDIDRMRERLEHLFHQEFDHDFEHEPQDGPLSNFEQLEQTVFDALFNTEGIQSLRDNELFRALIRRFKNSGMSMEDIVGLLNSILEHMSSGEACECVYFSYTCGDNDECVSFVYAYDNCQGGGGCVDYICIC